MLLIAAVVALTAIGCGSPPVIATPDGFVAIDEDNLRYDVLYQSVSADGAVIRLRRQDNEKFGTLDFWTEALSRELTKGRGYELVETMDVSSPSGSARVLQMRGTMEEQLYRYDVAIYVVGDDVYTIEAAAPEEAYEDHTGQFMAAFESLDVKE